MANEVRSELFRLKTLEIIEAKELRIYTGEFVLAPYKVHFRDFSYNTIYLGVARDFTKINNRPTVRLDPIYKVIMPEDGNVLMARISPGLSNLHPDFFPNLYAGPAEAIAESLRDAPFTRMKQLAEYISGLEVPYDESLKYFFEHKLVELREQALKRAEEAAGKKLSCRDDGLERMVG